MPSKKRVKFGEQPKKERKRPVIKQNPETYLQSYPSWQFNMMDFDFEHGWNHVVNRIQVGELNELELDLLKADCSDDLILQAINQCVNSEYVSLSRLIFEFEKTNSKIALKDLQIILKHIRSNFFWDEVFPKLQNFEKSKWAEINRQRTGKNGKSKHHNISVDKLSKPAKNRLKELNLDDLDEIFSFRLSGNHRVFGIRVKSCFKILWYDFDHKICPSNLKNT